MTNKETTTNEKPEHDLEHEEREFLAKYDASRYERPSVTTDVVIFTIQEQDLQVLLVQRGDHPYKNMWAIPGGFVNIQESLEAGARRELEEETGVQDVYMEQLYTFGEPSRDPRTRVITVAYFALVEARQVRTLRAGSDARAAGWFSVYRLPPLAFDHANILDYALTRLRYKLEYTNVAFQLLPELFTLTELQRVYEIVFNRPLDKRNFRKKLNIRELDQAPEPDKVYMIEETSEFKMEGSHRPARLHRFIDRVDRIIRGFI
ncbi:MAG: NUDIX hydrolase [Chloroflexi bacterium]|nr:NUDIX hydrolase [Chloroflexota bacterium]